jgi:CMP-N-acetylneuraminic acid synthetase
MDRLVAVIAARSGSVRVKNKNIRDFNGSTILELKIKQLKQIKQLDKVIVNTNCEEIMQIAKKAGAECVKRDDYFASNTVSMSEVFKNIAENVDAEYIMYANATNPLVKTESYEKAIDIFFKNKDKSDSLTSCHDVKEFLYLNNKPLNYDPKNQPRSQDLPDVIALNFAISILSRDNMIKFKNILGERPYFFKLDEVESIDIDTNLDFFIAEKVYETVKIKNKELLV